MHIAGYNERTKMESEEKIILAYLGAYWQRVKRMPDLKQLLGHEKKEQTTEEMFEQVKKLNAMFGSQMSG